MGDVPATAVAPDAARRTIRRDTLNPADAHRPSELWGVVDGVDPRPRASHEVPDPFKWPGFPVDESLVPGDHPGAWRRVLALRARLGGAGLQGAGRLDHQA